MISLSISSAFKPSIIPSSITQKPLKPPSLSFKPSPSQVSATAESPRLGLDSGLGLEFPAISSAPPSPATAARGAEGDVMGLLLRERIVFLGNQIDDFVADAIISQLLLLDAQDHTKDIRLFINSPGGSLRNCEVIAGNIMIAGLYIHPFHLGALWKFGSAVIKK